MTYAEEQTLSDAVTAVAQAARELSDNAQGLGTGYLVEKADMLELREMIALWTKASNSLIRAIQSNPPPGFSFKEKGEDKTMPGIGPEGFVHSMDRR